MAYSFCLLQDLLIYLDDFMELNFCTICEDNSTGELAEVSVSLIAVYIYIYTYIYEAFS